MDEQPTLRIGIDIGGTKIAGVLIAQPPLSDADSPHRTHITILENTEVPARHGADALIEDVMSVIETLIAQLAQARNITTDDAYRLISSIGIGTPGTVEDDHGTVRGIANLKIDRVELGANIHEATGLPVHVENDVNAAAVGAQALLHDMADAAVSNPPATGADGTTGTTASSSSSSARTCPPHATEVFLNLGTGIGAGIIRDGKLDHGYMNVAGEIGHVPVEPHHWHCACGQYGCLETAASGGAAARLWPYDDPPMPALIRKANDPDAPDHVEAAKTLRTVINAIADAIDVLAVTVDPCVIMIGGGMAKTGEPLLERIQAELHRREQDSAFIASLHLPERLVLVPANLPIGAVGAALAQ